MGVLSYFIVITTAHLAGWQVKLLFQDGATSLWIACQMGNAAIVKELLEASADVDAAREVCWVFHVSSLHASAMMVHPLKVRGRQNWHIHFIHFPENAEFSDNFDSNIGAQRFVSTEKFAFEVDDLRKRRRKRAAMMVCGDVMSLAYKRHEY